MKTETLILKIDPQLADRLAEHKRQTLVPTSAFVRFAIERSLGLRVLDAEPVHKADPLPLVAPEQPEKGAE
jgi:hypothetical protein